MYITVPVDDIHDAWSPLLTIPPRKQDKVVLSVAFFIVVDTDNLSVDWTKQYKQVISKGNRAENVAVYSMVRTFHQVSFVMLEQQQSEDRKQRRIVSQCTFKM